MEYSILDSVFVCFYVGVNSHFAAFMPLISPCGTIKGICFIYYSILF